MEQLRSEACRVFMRLSLLYDGSACFPPGQSDGVHHTGAYTFVGKWLVCLSKLSSSATLKSSRAEKPR